MSAIGPHLPHGSGTTGACEVLLNAVEWPVNLSILAYGVRISVRANVPGIVEALRRHLPPGSEYGESPDVARTYSLIVEANETSPRRGHSAYVNGALLIRCSTIEALLRAFEASVQLYVAEMAPERVFVHAGVVGHRGRAILLPGRSLTGKTTLVAELVRAGVEYYSDEYAVLDSAGGVHPYPRALSIRQGGGAGVRKQPVQALGGRAGIDALPVGLVVVTKFRPGGTWRPSRLSPGRGALALLANTVPARRCPEIVLGTLSHVVATAPVVAGERGEASTVIDAILELAG